MTLRTPRRGRARTAASGAAVRRSRPRGRARGSGSLARSAAGSAPIELVAGVGLLVLPVVLLVLALPAWSEVTTMGRAAAREAARVAATTSEDGPLADDAAARVAQDHGRPLAAPTEVTFSRSPAGEAVTATVTVEVPALVVPLVGEWRPVTRRISHTEPLDRYRSRP